jgi:succinate-semialdehyde dehydrogenase/glutarate-semialdehyde dehydrogenase
MTSKSAVLRDKSRGIMGPDSHLIKDRAFINGNWVEGQGKTTFSVLNPVDQTMIANVPDMDKEDVQAAINAAEAAFTRWSALSSLERADILEKWSALIVKRASDLAVLMTYEQGKPLKEAQGEVTAAAATIRWCAEEGRRLYGEFIDGQKPGSKIIVSRHPVGVCGAITPWNFPVGMITRKVGPALAAGCTVVLKPAESTPLSALALAALAQEAGLPAGVLNIVTSAKASEIGRVLTSDPRVRKISFTGSTDVGKKLMAQAAHNIQKVSLELGGNAPFIIFPSADLEKAVQGAIASKFRNAGQTCICANRIYVHKEIYLEFSSLFINKIKNLKVGPGWEQDVVIGPLINEEAIVKIERMIADVKKQGAKILLGGKRHQVGDSFFEPTLIEDAPDDAAIAREEIFGPVAVLYSFETEEEVVARANATEFGLASYIYTQDLAQAWRMSDSLAYGMVAINESMLASDLAPFGGIKTSGIGREGGRYGLLEYTDLKYRLFG